jgi:hypothetical protein
VVSKNQRRYTNHHKLTTKKPRFYTPFFANRQQKRPSTTPKKLTPKKSTAPAITISK